MEGGFTYGNFDISSAIIRAEGPHSVTNDFLK
jgi:hypothetical protein